MLFVILVFVSECYGLSISNPVVLEKLNFIQINLS